VGAVILAGAATALALAFGAMAGLGDLYVAVRRFTLLFGLASLAYALAVAWVVWRPPVGRAAVGGVLLAAVAFRLILLPTEPRLSTDLYRYLWDGRLAAAGVSPYQEAPSAPALEPFRDATVYPWLNHVDWRTVYPPGAQLLFAGVAHLAPSSVLAMKLLILGFDLATMVMLVGWLRALGRPPVWLLVYAWHPLVVVELTGNGHLDAVALAATVAALWAAARGREAWAAALLGAGALVKLYPLLLLPAVWRRPGRAVAGALVVVGAGYALYAREGWAVLGSLARYVAEEEFAAGVRAALDVLLGPLGSPGRLLARLLPLAGLAGLALAVGRWDAAPDRRARWLVGGYLLAAPSLFPWYALWMVPLLAVAPTWPWLYFSCAIALGYLSVAEPVWHMPAWVIAAQWLPLALGLAWQARPGLAAPRWLAWRASP
jgi:hypothetical protein